MSEHFSIIIDFFLYFHSNKRSRNKEEKPIKTKYFACLLSITDVFRKQLSYHCWFWACYRFAKMISNFFLTSTKFHSMMLKVHLARVERRKTSFAQSYNEALNFVGHLGLDCRRVKFVLTQKCCGNFSNK